MAKLQQAVQHHSSNETTSTYAALLQHLGPNLTIDQKNPKRCEPSLSNNNSTQILEDKRRAEAFNKNAPLNNETLNTGHKIHSHDVPESSMTNTVHLWWKHLLSGALAGGVSRTCTAPLDRLKVFLQVNSNMKTKYNVISAVRHLNREGGLFSFWRGNFINVMKIAPESALKFAAYEQIKRELQLVTNHEKLTVYDRFLAGSFAGAFAQTVIYPLEVLKTRLALRRTGELDRGQGVLHFALKLSRKEGIGAFYKGFWPNLCGIIPYAGIDLAVYETLKRQYSINHPNKSETSVYVLIGCGVCSSTCGQIFTYPFALIRTRLQARTVSTDPNHPTTARALFYYILQHEGLPGLYRGMIPNFCKVIPAVAISWVVYEKVRKYLGATMT